MTTKSKPLFEIMSKSKLAQAFDEREERMTPFLGVDSVELLDDLKDIIALACGHDIYGDGEPPPKCWLITEEEYQKVKGRLDVLWERALKARDSQHDLKRSLRLITKTLFNLGDLKLGLKGSE
jgi:hypothetical protein